MFRTACRLVVVAAPFLLNSLSSPGEAVRRLSLGVFLKMASAADDGKYKQAKSVYEFKANDIDGKEVSMDKYKDNVVIMVNVACECGYTPKSYPQLQALYQKYGPDGLRIAAFPCNQFRGQEPGAEPEIKKYVQDNFNVTFDMYSKIDVNGDNAHPLFKYLKYKQGGLMFDAIKWNFTKFLIDRSGQPIKRYGPNDAPFDWEGDVAKALGVEKKP